MIELASWMDNFSKKTGKRNIGITSVNWKTKEGYDWLEFCLKEPSKECYVMMRDKTDARLLARRLVIKNCDFDQDCPKDDLEKELYAREKAEDEWCSVLSGEDYGCEETNKGHVYWQEL